MFNHVQLSFPRTFSLPLLSSFSFNPSPFFWDVVVAGVVVVNLVDVFLVLVSVTFHGLPLPLSPSLQRLPSSIHELFPLPTSLLSENEGSHVVRLSLEHNIEGPSRSPRGIGLQQQE